MTGEQQRPLVARTEQTVSSHLGRALAEVSSSAVVDRTSAVCICEKTILDLPRNWLGVDRPTRALIVCPALTRRRRWCVSQLAAGKATKSPKTRWRHAKADAGHFPASPRRQQSLANVTVIDVRAGLFSSTLRKLRDISFLDAAKQGNSHCSCFRFSVLLLPPWRKSRQPASLMKRGRHFLVKNFINDASFFDWEFTRYR